MLTCATAVSGEVPVHSGRAADGAGPRVGQPPHARRGEVQLRLPRAPHEVRGLPPPQPLGHLQRLQQAGVPRHVPVLPRTVRGLQSTIDTQRISISTFSMAAGTGGGGGGAATPPSSRYTFSSRTSSRVLAAVSSVSRLVVMACRTCQSGVSIPTRVTNQVSVFPRACAPGRPRLSPPRPPDTRTPPHRTGRTAVRGGRWCPTTARCPACRRNPRPR